MEQVWTAELTSAQLATWLNPPRVDAPYAILERLDDLDFPTQDESISVDAWQRGRIFGANYELRWEVNGDSFKATYIGQTPPAAPFQSYSITTEAVEIDSSFLLTGQGRWLAGRKLEYRSAPPGNGQLVISTREVRSPNGSLILERYLGIHREA